MSPISRRAFLRGLGAATAAVTGGSVLSARAAVPAGADVDLDLRLEAVADRLVLRSGAPTNVWRYRGTILAGDSDRVQEVIDSYLGPTLHLRRGERVRIRFINRLPEPSIVHWHGLHVPERADGHPRFAVPGGGGEYIYEFTVADRAGTYWYHPHPHGRTGPQVYAGLAGLIVISDGQEASLGLPTGDFDLPLVIQDRVLGADNQWQYVGGGRMARMMGFLGDRVLVNGQLDYQLSVAPRAYRLRLLNGSDSRIYKLAWDRPDMSLTVIGTDGGLLERPVQRNFITLAPAERVDLWVDFSPFAPGSELILKSLAFDSPTRMPGMMGRMMMGSAGTPNGAALSVCRVRVDGRPKDGPATALAGRLSEPVQLKPENARNADRVRRITLTMAMMRWGLNGRQFEMNAVAPDEVVKLGSQEIWEFANQGGLMGGMMAHPMHVHGLQFSVVERDRSGVETRLWSQLAPGFVTEGRKDTVLVLPGERVRIQLSFEDFTGLYLYHCHNLVHEDQGMMRNYRVVAA